MTRLVSIIAISAVLAACEQPIPNAPAPLVEVTVIDGDTFDLNGERVRLHGVDAPERDGCLRASGGRERMCGPGWYDQASDALVAILARPGLACEAQGTDRYDRTIGRCRNADGDVARQMVARGWAVDWPKYSHGEYAGAEMLAKTNNRGIWK